MKSATATLQHTLIVLELNTFQKKKNISNRNIITNIYRIQAFDSIMCGYFCIGFIDLMLQGKGLLDYSNSFSPNKCENNDKMIK